MHLWLNWKKKEYKYSHFERVFWSILPLILYKAQGQNLIRSYLSTPKLPLTTPTRSHSYKSMYLFIAFFFFVVMSTLTIFSKWCPHKTFYHQIFLLMFGGRKPGLALAKNIAHLVPIKASHDNCVHWTSFHLRLILTCTAVYDPSTVTIGLYEHSYNRYRFDLYNSVKLLTGN